MKILLTKRVVAFLIDLIIINIVTITIDNTILKEFNLDYSLLKFDSILNNGIDVKIMILGFGTFNIIYFLYFLLQESIISSTFGKVLLSIKVVSNGEKLHFIEGIKRNLIRFLFSFFPFIDYGWILFNKDEKTLHDLLSGTKVVMSS